MTYSTTVGVDLAKNVIQVSVVSGRGKELSNRCLTRRKFAEFLGKQKLSLVAFESCASAHYWARASMRHGHEARIIPAKAVAPFRQGHKTDRNDALAVAETARRPNIKLELREDIETMTREVDSLVKQHPVCKRLTAIEGIGPIGALSLHAVSILIQGARAYVYRMKEPRSLKDRWLKDLIERAGPNRAAVALANKNVRTAWAMVTQGTEYQRREQLDMAA